MSEITLTKIDRALFILEDQESVEAVEGVRRGGIITCKFTRNRHPVYHRKFFALLNTGYEAWEPDPVDLPEGVSACVKRFEAFRKGVIIAAGHYEASYVLRPDGSTAVELTAKSISFGSMGQSEFERVYSDVANVLLEKILTNYTRDDLDEVVDRILGMV